MGRCSETETLLLLKLSPSDVSIHMWIVSAIGQNCPFFLYMYLWIHILLELKNPILSIFILLLKWHQLWPLDIPWDWLACFFNVSIFLKTFPYLLVPRDVSDPSCILPAPSLESTTCLRNPGSFYWRMMLKKQRLCAKCAHCCEGVTTGRPSHLTEQGNICVY